MESSAYQQMAPKKHMLALALGKLLFRGVCPIEETYFTLGGNKGGVGQSMLWRVH